MARIMDQRDLAVRHMTDQGSGLRVSVAIFTRGSVNARAVQ